MSKEVFASLSVDHIRFYVSDVAEASAQWQRQYGMRTCAAGVETEERSELVGAGDVRFLLTEALVDDHPGTFFVAAHGDGVADIALRTTDAAKAHTAAVARGARTISSPMTREGVTTATIAGFGDVAHTFVQRADDVPEDHLPGLRQDGRPEAETRLRTVDHIAVCLETGQLEPTVRFYTDVLDFAVIFSERIVIGNQAMDSHVVQSPSGSVTLTLVEQDRKLDPGQVDEFVKNHGGAGVQHLALLCDDIVGTVGTLRANGVDFLSTPDAYYDALGGSLTPRRYSIPDLRALHLLVDSDHDGQLFQIFARSTHPRRTYFTEVIERMGATTFGSGNIKALYEAVQQASTP